MLASLSLPTMASSDGAGAEPGGRHGLVGALCRRDPCRSRVPSIVSPKIGSFDARDGHADREAADNRDSRSLHRAPLGRHRSHEDGLLVDLAGRKVTGYPPVSHDQHPVGVRDQLGDLRGDQDNRDALRSDAAQDRIDFRLGADIDAARRLVQD